LNPDAVIVELHSKVTEAERALSLLEGVASRVEDPTLLISPFQYREARLSSAIENTFASAEQMALFGVDPSTIEEPKRDDVLEVNNYAAALQHGFESDQPISLRLVKDLHAILLRNIKRRAGIPGQFRTSQNAIARAGNSFESARFVPPPHMYIADLLKNWEQYVHVKESKLPRLVRFAITHYQFECIHPFDDGNGRIGRLLVALQLCEQAQLSKPLVYVSGYFERHRSTYYDLLYEVSTKGAWTRWIRFFLEAIAVQARDAADRFGQLDDLRDRYHKLVREKRASALLPSLVDRLFFYPAITIAQVCEKTAVSPQSAGVLIKRLEEKKIIMEATGRKSHRVWIAPEILRVMES